MQKEPKEYAFEYAGFWIRLGAGIKVTHSDKNPITSWDSMLRYYGNLASLFSLCAGSTIIAFDEKKQGFHDKIASTYVVKLPMLQVVLISEPYARGESILV